VEVNMARRLLEPDAMATSHTQSRQGASDRARARARAREARGFTLVELAVVVVIVGVLSVLAVVGYRKMTLSSKMTEATNVVGAIRIAQEDYKAEAGVYATGSATYCPTGAGLSNVKVMWNTTCGGFAGLAVHVDGMVQFQYATDGGGKWNTDPSTIKGVASTWIDLTGMPAGRPWYLVRAFADLDGDSTSGPSEVVATSATGNMFTRNEGY
jgi:prepilin-type N-terminal cleavage/methylation domain-containing protein